MVAHAFHPSTWKTEARRSLSSGPKDREGKRPGPRSVECLPKHAGTPGLDSITAGNPRIQEVEVQSLPQLHGQFETRLSVRF